LVIKKDFRIGVSLKAKERYRSFAFNDRIGGLVDWQIANWCVMKSKATIEKLSQHSHSPSR